VNPEFDRFDFNNETVRCINITMFFSFYSMDFEIRVRVFVLLILDQIVYYCEKKMFFKDPMIRIGYHRIQYRLD